MVIIPKIGTDVEADTILNYKKYKHSLIHIFQILGKILVFILKKDEHNGKQNH